MEELEVLEELLELPELPEPPQPASARTRAATTTRRIALVKYFFMLFSLSFF